MLGLKGEGRGFPLGQDIGVLKWRLQTTDDSLLPLFSELAIDPCTTKAIEIQSPVNSLLRTGQVILLELHNKPYYH